MSLTLLTIEEIVSHPSFRGAVEQIVKSKNERLFTRKEAAEQLRISLPTLDRHIKDNLIKSRKQGTRVLIPESELTNKI